MTDKPRMSHTLQENRIAELTLDIEKNDIDIQEFYARIAVLDRVIDFRRKQTEVFRAQLAKETSYLAERLEREKAYLERHDKARPDGDTPADAAEAAS